MPNYLNSVDAIVTDFPYGKSTTTKGEDMENLYLRAFESISKVLKTGGRAVIGISRNDLIKLGKEYLSYIETHEFRAHRSLNRYFVVFKK
jgi:tRNA (guanine10-N2)-dimethyltransferase